MTKEQIISKIQNFILRGETEKALEILLRNTIGKPNREALILSNRFTEIKRKQRLGIVNLQEEQLEVNKINNSVLNILDYLTQAEYSKKYENKEKESKLAKSNLAQIILAFCAVVTIIVTGISQLSSFSIETKNQPVKNPISNSIEVPVEKTAVEDKVSYNESDTRYDCIDEILKENYNILPYCYTKLIMEKKIDKARMLLKEAKLRTIKKDRIEFYNSELNDLDLIEKLNIDNAFGEYSPYTSITEKDEKYGISTKGGKVFFDCIFDEVDPQVFYPLIMVEENGKQGFVNQEGRIVHSPKFESTDPQIAAPLIAFKSESLWGIMDTLGNILQEPQFEQMDYVAESRIGVKKGGYFGFINNENGSIEVEVKYSNIEPYESGKAKVRLLDKEFLLIKMERK